MNLLGLLVQVVSGVAGGIVAGGLFGRLSSGWPGNALAGLIGGGIGCQLVSLGLRHADSLPPLDGLDFGTLAAQAAGGCIGGIFMTVSIGLLTLIVGQITRAGR
jgi:hypothetical protein